jgi:hypothetical protein
MATKKSTTEATATRKKASPIKAKALETKEKPKSTGRKTRTVGKSNSKLPAGLTLESAPSLDPVIPHDQIALRAYFIGERRQQMGWHGNSHTDWVDAEAQLKAEVLKKPLKKR